MWAVLVGALFLGNAAPSLKEFSTARGAAAYVFHLIDRVPAIDIHSDRGEKPQFIRGNVHFQNVVFAYPARKDIPVLRKLTLRIEDGQTVALVGPSGYVLQVFSSKSTGP